MIAPDFSRSFLKLPRPVLKLLIGDPRMLAVYVALLERARYDAPGAEVRHGQVIDLDVGQMVMGREKIALETGTSENEVRGALKRLIRTGLITIKVTSKGSIVTICGYKETAASDRSGSPADSPADSPAAHQQLTSSSPLTRSRDVEINETSSAGSCAPPSPGGWRPPAGGKADAEGRRRVAAAELADRDVVACWTYLEQQGIAADPPAKQDARAFGAIKICQRRRPSATEPQVRNYDEGL